MKMLFIGLYILMTSLGSIMQAQDFSASPMPNPNQNVIILLGPPGSGKGTQAKRLSVDFAIPHISTGDLFRENIGKNTDLGKKAKTFMDAGKLVPDELVLEMLFDRVSHPDGKQGYILDGFPRTIPQAEAFARSLSPDANLIVVNLDIPDDLIIKRISGRLTCQKCGTIYNKYFSPPAKERVCDKCSGELIQRPDDKAEVVMERLRVYHSQTEPLIQYYKDKGQLFTVDGTKSPDEVYGNLQKALYKSISR